MDISVGDVFSAINLGKEMVVIDYDDSESLFECLFFNDDGCWSTRKMPKDQIGIFFQPAIAPHFCRLSYLPEILNGYNVDILGYHGDAINVSTTLFLKLNDKLVEISYCAMGVKRIYKKHCFLYIKEIDNLKDLKHYDVGRYCFYNHVHTEIEVQDLQNQVLFFNKKLGNSVFAFNAHNIYIYETPKEHLNFTMCGSFEDFLNFIKKEAM